MALPQVGLEAVIDNLAGFSKGADTITKAYDKIDTSADKVAKSSGGLSGVFSSVGGGLLSLGKVAAGVALGGVTLLGGGLVALGTKAVLSAADVGEMQSLFNTAFGQDAPKARQEIDEFAAAVGRNKFELEGFAGGIKSLVTPMGLTGDLANEVSIGFSKLAVDLSSFYNVTESDALESLRSGLIGETEPLRKFGVVLNEAAIKAKAMELGLIEMTVDSSKLEKAQGSITKAQLAYNKAVEKFGPESDQAKVAQINLTDAQNRLNDVMAGSPVDLNAAQKAQATYALIMEQTALAQGDATRTSGSWVNQTRALKSVIDETVVSIGMELIPILTPLLQKITELAKTWLPVLADTFTNVAKGANKFVSLFLEGWSDAIDDGTTFFDSFVGGLQSSLTNVFGIDIKSPIFKFIFALKDLGNKVLAEFGASGISVGDILKNVLGAAIDFLVNTILPALTTGIRFIVDNWDTFKLAISKVVKSVMSVAVPAFEFISGIIIDYVIPAIRDVVTWFKKDVPAGSAKLQSALKPIINKILPELVDIFNIIYKWTIKNWPLIQKTIVTVLNFIWDQIKIVTKSILYIWENWGDEIMKVVVFVFKVVKINLQNMLDTVTLIMQLITGDWEGAWKTIKSIGERSLGLIVGMIKASFNDMLKLVTDIMNSIKGKMSEIWSSIVNEAKNKVNEVYNAIKSKFDSLASLIAGYATSLLNAARTMMQGIINGINSMLSSITSTLSTVMTNATNSLRNAITSGSIYSTLVSVGQSVMNAIKNGISAVTDLASRLIATVQGAINQLSSAMSSGTIYNILVNTGHKIINTIRDAVTSVTDFASAIKSKLGEWLGDLVSGSLYTTLRNTGRKIVEEIKNGFIGAQNVFNLARDAIKNWILSWFSPIPEARYAGGEIVDNILLGFYAQRGKFIAATRLGLTDWVAQAGMGLNAVIAPPVNAPALGATGSTSIYNTFQVGGNTINSGMDQAQFEARVLRVIRKNL